MYETHFLLDYLYDSSIYNPLHHTCALFFVFKGKFPEADRLFQRAIEIYEEGLGSNHPALATALNNRAAVLKAQVGAVGNS